MPYTAKQNRVFRAISHGWHPNKGSLASISREEATKMASEGVKQSVSGARKRHSVAKAMKSYR